MQGDYGQIYARLYHNHWWWRSRERILMRMLRSLHLPQPCTIMDVGCGDGLFFPCLRSFGDVSGIEVDPSLLSENGPDRSRISTAPLGDLAHSQKRYDLITALDVVEHIEDDRKAIADMVDMLRPGGHLVMTVPAFNCLWDRHDDINHHYRRYRLSQLRRHLPPSVRIVSQGYLFHSLFVPKWLFSKVNKALNRSASQIGIPAKPLNSLATLLCDLEHRVLGPLRLPFGTSVYLIARKAEPGPDDAKIGATAHA